MTYREREANEYKKCFINKGSAGDHRENKLVLEGWKQEKEGRGLFNEAIFRSLIMDEAGFVIVELGNSEGADGMIFRFTFYDLPVQHKHRALISRWIKCSIFNVVLQECFKFISRIIILIVD